tara:strand:- start:1992 stop:2291 length:300 start_codon:yes stop_codon:yes gene_type:complete
MVNVRGLMMEAKDIDDDGVWDNNGQKVELLGSHLPIPDDVRSNFHPDRQEVLMLIGASEILSKCPSCGVNAEGIILVTQFTKMYPAHCCNKIVWMTEED